VESCAVALAFDLAVGGWRSAVFSSSSTHRISRTVIVIVIGGLKSRGLTNTPIVCAKKDFSCRNPNYP
jgi:hypothetical protein